MKYPFHEETQKWFPDFDYRKPNGDRNVICDMRDPNNGVGYQQRAFSCWWALERCGPLDLGLDLGSPRGLTPHCIHVDVFGNGDSHPFYGGGAYRADVTIDASHLGIFPKDTFPLVMSNHSLEHMGSLRVTPITLLDSDSEIVHILRNEWIRVLRPGGILAMIVPDNDAFDVLAGDKDHKHAWGASDFKFRITDHLSDLVELVDFDTLRNHHSFDVVLRKKG